MKGRLRKLMEGNYVYTIHRFSDNHEYCVWNRQNVSEFGICGGVSPISPIPLK